MTENYITYSPNGKYIKIAQKKVQEANILREKRDYEKAVSENKIKLWNEFIKKYPNSINIDYAKNSISKIEKYGEQSTNDNDLLKEKSSYDEALLMNNSYLWKLFIKNYPKSKNIEIAKARYADTYFLEEKKDYEDAILKNTSYTWQAFVDKFPYRKDILIIKKNIIKCKVEEILASEKTGHLPLSEYQGSSNSKMSEISITNNTNCLLTLMYLGNDIIEVNLEVGQTKKIKLSSGGYSVAAMACGYSYGGRESLKGNNAVKYTITSK